MKVINLDKKEKEINIKDYVISEKHAKWKMEVENEKYISSK